MAITVNLVDVPDLEIHINLGKLTIRDWPQLRQLSTESLEDDTFLDLLDKVIAEDVRDLPITAIVPIMEALKAELEGAGNPEVDGKN